ncbi:S1 family peptidase [Sciscionella sediminilitoris]|uniref:S1 family peptidase n=1 Tax=Sciscionella sediminilitoris TaxID=1445613 RepID=UPI0004DF2702|nr:serine protease [Sciscionella sp. SE31]
MLKRLLATATAVLAGTGFALALAVPAGAATGPSAAPDFHATLKLSNCSGALVRMPESKGTDKALAISNGHCYDIDALKPGVALVNKPDARSFGLLDASGAQKATLKATTLVYATMTDTDVSLYSLDKTYDQIKSQTGIEPLNLSANQAKQGDPITVASGYFTEKWNCSVDGFVPQLKEADWTWKNSIRYTKECTTKHGTSGSPIIAADGTSMVGINNTGNDDGQRCTLNNPCEVDKQGNITVHKGQNYGQQTDALPKCFEGSKLNLSKQGCTLTKPHAG